jgi:AcrR family transcriptional regulator
MPRVSVGYLAARREQIVQAASRLFAERGFSRTTMADVVAASGLSTGAVYNYFPSKSDLRQSTHFRLEIANSLANFRAIRHSPSLN